MKLHLPKQLFTALITAITLAAPATLTTGSAAWGADMTFTGTNNTEINTTGTATEDTVTFQMTDATSKDVSNNYFTGTGGVTAANIVISDDDTTETLEGWVITNGNTGNKQIYTGTLTGDGILKKIGPSSDNAAIFEGDATGYTGDIYLGTSASFTLTFGGRDGAVAAAATTNTKGIAGTGSVYFSTNNNNLSFNYSASENPVYITNAISESSACTSTIHLKGGANYIFTKSVAVDTIDIASGASWTLLENRTFGTAAAVKGAGKLIVSDGVTAEITAEKAIQTHVLVNGGGTLKSSVVDGTWYESDKATKSITLAGSSAEKMATFEVTERQTFITPTYMNGYAQISGSGSLQLFSGATFTVSGTNNIISTALTTSRASVFDIAEGGTLEISGQVTRNSSNASGDSITKRGGGELIFSHADNSIMGGLTIEAGEVTIAEGGQININSTISNAGTLNINGTLNISSPSDFELNVAGYSSSSTDYTATNDNGYAYSSEILLANGTVTIGENGVVTGVTSYRIDAEKGLIGVTDAISLRTQNFYVNTGTVKLGTGTGEYSDYSAASKYIVKTGATLNINGKILAGRGVELDSGATLANGLGSTDTGAEVGQGKAQLATLSLTGDATVYAHSNFGLLASSWGETTMDLNGHTLTKDGAGKFFLVQTTVNGGGKIVTSAGTLQIGCGDSNNNASNKVTTANNVVFSMEANGTLNLVNGGKLIAQGVEGTAGIITGASGTTLQLESTASHEYQGSVTGGFNLIKKGAGTQTFSGATNLGTVTVEAGTLALGGSTAGAPTAHSIGSLNATSGTLSIAGNASLALGGGTVGTLSLTGNTANAISLNAGATLTVTSTLSGLSAGSVTLGEASVLDLTGLHVGNGNPALFVTVNNAVSGAGLVKYQGYNVPTNDSNESQWRVSLRESAALTLNTDVQVLQGIALNTYNVTDKHIYSSKNLTVGGELRLESQARLSVSAGTVSAGTIGLGHVSAGNPGHIELTGGTITTGGITKTSSTESGNTLTMSGGVLEITSAAGIASGIQTTISGGTLKATQASWGVTVTSIGNATFDIAAGQSITVNGTYNLTGTLTLIGHTATAEEVTTTGTLVLGGTMNVTGTQLLEHAENTYTGGTVAGNGFYSGKYYLVKNTDNADITTTGLSVTLGGEAVAAENISLSDSDNHLLLTTTGSNGIFYVNTGTETAQATTLAADGYVRHQVATGATLNLTLGDAALSAAQAATLITGTTGTGTMVLQGTGTQVTGATVFQGDLKVDSSNSDLTLGTGQGSTVDLSSLNSLILNGGSIKWNAVGSTLQKLDVQADSDLTIFDMQSDSTLTVNTVAVAENTTLTINKDVEENESWKQNLNIGVLTGAGSVVAYGPGQTGDGEEHISYLTIGSLKGFTGDLSIASREVLNAERFPSAPNRNRLQATINTGADGASFNSLTFSGFGEADETSTATFNVQGDTQVNTLSAANATVNIDSGKTLTLGDGTSETAHSIGTLTSAAGTTVTLTGGAELTLTSVSGVSGKIAGDGTLTLATGSTIEGIPTALFAASLNTLKLTGGTCLEITGSGQKNAFGNIKNLVIESGSTFGNRLTGQIIGTAEHTLTLAGAGGVSGEPVAALAFGQNTSYSDEMTMAHTVQLAGDATVWVNDSRVGILSGTVSGEGHVLTKSGAGTLKLTNDVNTQGLVVSEGALELSGGSSAMQTVTLGSSATLTLGNGTDKSEHSLGTVVADSGGNTISLHQNATLSKITKGTGSGNITLIGSGVYDLGAVENLGSDNNTIGAVVGVTTDSLKDSANWTGTVSLSGTISVALLNNMGNANSWVEVASDGLSGYLNTSGALNASNVSELTPNIRLTGNLDLNTAQAVESKHYIFQGDFAGSGDFIVSHGGTGYTYEFNGDVSEWNGDISQTGSASTTLKFTGDASEINTSISKTEGTLNLEINTTNDAAISKDVTVSQLVVNNTAKLTGESNSITAGGVEISQQNASLSNVTVQGSSIAATSKTDGAKGSISGAHLVQLQQDATFTIEDMTLTNTSITAATVSTRVELNNVTNTGVQLAQGAFHMLNAATDIAAGTENVGTGGSVVSFGTSLLSGLTLNAGNDSSVTVDLGDLSGIMPAEYGTYTLSITLSGFAMDTYESVASGAGVLFAADSWLGQLLVQNGATQYVSGSVETPATVSEGGSSSVSVSYSAATGDNVGTIITITGLSVPEPATATLSLLALAALAARRRRK